ncbi:MAG: polysaccharide biosynthesis protein [Alphaproteobacteria bacterium]|nr:polysaccharide biosynthesis protein [Alphaproteobacteria bacterium]
MHRLKGKIIKLAFDYMLASASVWGAYYLYMHGQMPSLDGIIRQALVFSAFFAGFSVIFGTHRAVWRYTSMQDLMGIAMAVALTLFSFGVFQHFVVPEFIFAPSFIIMQALVLTALVAGGRMGYRFLHEGPLRRSWWGNDGAARSRILLVGAGNAADKFIKSIRQNPESGYEIVGLIDNRRTLLGDMLHGVPILGKGNHLDKILSELATAKRSPNRLVFTENTALGGADFKDIPQAVLDNPDSYGLKLARLPNPEAFADFVDTDAEGETRVKLKPIAIEDLLGRPQATLDMQSIRGLISGKRVAITGAGGSIGSELCRQIAKLDPAAMAMIDFSEYNLYALELDINDISPAFPWRCQLCNVRVAEQLRKVFSDFKPDIVFHAAALKHVPLVEANPAEGVLTNVMGTRIVAEACRDMGVGIMVQISTDKAVNPCNVMGATKRVGEFLAQSLDLEATGNTRFVTVRFGNVLGSSGSVVPLFRKQLEKGGPLTVTHPEISRFFMTISEAVSLVLQASAHALRHTSERGRILVLDMGEPVKIVDVARQMIRLANLRPDKDIKIEYIGLRPGEKMFEELFDTAEQRTATDSPQVLAAISQPTDAALLRRSVANLEEAAMKGDDMAVIRLLQTIVPGYAAAGGEGASAIAGQYRKNA